MRAIADGDEVFVADDSFENLVESQAVFGSCHDFCVAAAAALLASAAQAHTSYVLSGDVEGLVWPRPGRAVRVTVEWTDAEEAR